MKYPKNLTYATQNAFDPTDGAIFLFYDNKFADVASDSNPLLAVISKNIGYMKFDVSRGIAYEDESKFILEMQLP
ncbi:MAG: hypothetical protein ACD_46C00331G0002 [uncultured bacterium]|nr:MAG: hypothetical protein ACD_46C00331G0002 [uncultured bacterium]